MAAHVLIVEDDAAILELLSGILEHKYRVSCVGTVAGAMAILRTSHVDVVLVDQNLPDGCGREVAVVAEAAGIVAIEMAGTLSLWVARLAAGVLIGPGRSA